MDRFVECSDVNNSQAADYQWSPIQMCRNIAVIREQEVVRFVSNQHDTNPLPNKTH